MRALAELHDLWIRATDPTITMRAAESPAMAERRDKLRWWIAKRDLGQQVMSQLLRLPEDRRQKLRPLALRTAECLHRIGRKTLQQVEPLADCHVLQHFVIRDLWSDHVLFCDERVTGVVDFGAARVDEPAVDLARLTGSLEPYDSELRVWAIQKYLANRQNTAGGNGVGALLERTRVLDESSTLLSALQWLDWTILSPREFPGKEDFIQKRWNTFLERVEGLSGLGWFPGPPTSKE